VNTTLLRGTNRRPPKPKIEIILERAPTFKENYTKRQKLAQENQELKKALDEGRKRVQEELKKLSPTPQ
jgi:hypothetical protein